MIVSDLDLLEAVGDMAHCLGDGLTAMHVGPRFTCGEAESIADVMRAAGFTDAADVWIEGHAAGDEPGDMHHPDTEES